MKIFWVIVTVVFFSFNLSLLAKEAEVEGILEVIMATEIPRGKCEPVYFVNTNGKRTGFSLPAHAPTLKPGQKIKISGRWEEIDGKKSFRCRKVTAVATAEPVAKKAATSANNAEYLPKQRPVLGEQNILVVCVSSLDTEDETPVWGKEKIEDKIFSNQHSLTAYWGACSLDKVWLTGDILDDGNWKKMEKSWTEYGYGSCT